MRPVLFFIALFLFLPSAAMAQSSYSLVLSDEYDSHFLSPYLQQHSQNDPFVTARDVVSYSQNPKNNFDISNSLYYIPQKDAIQWLSFRVKNASQTENWVIDFGSTLKGRFGFLKNIEIYLYNLTDGALTQIEAPKGQIINIPLPPRSNSKIIVKLEKSAITPALLPVTFKTEARYFDEIRTSNQNWIFMLLLIGISLFSGFFLLRFTYEALGFAGFFGIICLFLFLQQNIVHMDLWLVSALIIPFAVIALSLTGLFISYIFWSGSNQSHIFQLAVKAWAALLIVLPLISLIIPVGPLKNFFLIGPFALSIIAHIALNIYFSRHSPLNMQLMIGWLILGLGLSVSILSIAHIIQPLSFFINGFYYAAIIHLILAYFALREHFKIDNDFVFSPSNLQIDEDDAMSRLRETKENTEQARLLKVIEQERKVMSELRKSEARRTEEMRLAKEKADEANRAKSAFLAVVSHEIRTPMTGIMGMVRLLLNTNLSKDQKEYTQTIQDSSDAMLSLLNDILDFEKIEQGKMTFENVSFDMFRLLRGIGNLMSGHAAQKGTELEIKTGENLPKYVKGDMARLRQVLLNLIGNAIKFTDQGTVTLTVELMNEKNTTSKQYEIYFGVSDSGIGISEEAQKNLFNPFSQADSSISRKFGGTGLGLAISKGLVKGMGSNININSTLGEGSTFFFTLSMDKGQSKEAVEDSNHHKIFSASEQEEPKQQKQQEIQEGHNDQTPSDIPSFEKNIKTELDEEAQTPNQNQPPDNNEPYPPVNKTNIEKTVPILAVDDNAINLSVIQGLLSDTPYDVDTAQSAEAALYKLEQKTYHLILMDIQLPAMTGDIATQKIRQEGADSYKNIPIIALTGNVMPDHIDHYKACGMNDVLEKPINQETMIEMINQYIGNHQIQEQGQEQETTSLTDKPSDKTEHLFNAENSNNNLFNPETLETLKTHLNADDLYAMIDDVMTKSSEIIVEMQQALQIENRDILKAKGHELKGMAGNFGLTELSRIAGVIEATANHDPIVKIMSNTQILPTILEQTQQQVAEWINH